MPRTNCPDVATWQALLVGHEGNSEALVQHLETCRACRNVLDELAAEPDLWRDAARGVLDPTREETALQQLLDQMKQEEPLPLEDMALPFLQPSEKPNLLGLLGQYEVEKEIGRGGMGIVFKALDPTLNRVVAIKVMSPFLATSAVARRRFTREAQAAAAVSHDHLVAVHAVHEIKGLPYLVMQYVPGNSLQERLDRTGPLELAEVVSIALQTASGLAAAHAQGLIHRDIKPANLLLENGLSRVKITDFGLARLADDVGLTGSGVVAGTPPYMAPEQARGEPIDHRVDLFSLGSVMYAMCTGRPPFRGSTAVAVLRQVSDVTPTSIRTLNPDIPAWLEALIARLMAKQVADRFGSAQEVADLLEGYLAHLRQPTTILAPELPPVFLSPSKNEHGATVTRKWLLYLAAGAFALVLLVLLFLLAPRFGLDLGSTRTETPMEPGTRKLQEYHLSLKGPPTEEQGWEVVGPYADECVKFEPQGLRITLPKEYDGPFGFHKTARPDTGLEIATAVKGDFEITVSYEILQEPAKADAGFPQTRFSLDLGVDRYNNRVTTLSRRQSTWGGSEFFVWISDWDPDTGKHEPRMAEFPTRTKGGRLRITRTGSTLAYYVAGPNDGFTLLREFSFTADSVESVRLVATTGGPKAAIDVRATDLNIRGETLQRTTDVTMPAAEIKGKLGIVLALLGVLGTATVVLIVVRRRKGVQGTPAVTEEADQPEKSEPQATAISFACSGCGKKLKARAAQAGKQLKCPGCGHGVQVAAVSE